MEFKKSEPIKATIYGKEYQLKKPSFSASRKLSRDLKNLGEEEALDVLNRFLIEMGLSQEILDEMESDHVLQLCEYLSPKKK